MQHAVTSNKKWKTLAGFQTTLFCVNVQGGKKTRVWTNRNVDVIDWKHEAWNLVVDDGESNP